MAKAKKALSLILAAVMLMGVMSLISFAADAPAGQEATISFSYDKGSYAAGETVTLTVKLTSNYFVAPAAIPVEFDAAAATYTGTGGVTGGALFGSVAATETAAFLSDGLLYVALTPRASQNAVAQQCADVLLFTATFTANTAISDPTKVFGVLDDQKTMSNLSGKLFVGSYETADIKSTVYATGQTLNYPVMQEGPTEPNTLVVKDSFIAKESVVIDKYAPAYFMGDTDTTGIIYGIETIGYYDGFNTIYLLADVLSTTLGDAYLRITPSNDAEGYESTGTLIEVLDVDGTTVLETYYFVYFGDINGDGYVDNNDVTTCSSYALDESSLETIYEIIAGDVNGDTYTDNSDGTAIGTSVLNDSGYVSQEEIAVLFYGTIAPEYGI